jgi:hypothetical protein
MIALLIPLLLLQLLLLELELDRRASGARSIPSSPSARSFTSILYEASTCFLRTRDDGIRLNGAG